MLRNIIKRSLGVCALSVAAAVLCTGVATASPRAMVFSDFVKFSGTTTPGPGPGTYNFRSTKCALHSDGETTKFPCVLTAQLTVNSTGTVTGPATIQSPDGMTNLNVTIKPATGTNFTLTGKGTEADAPDPGEPPPPAYPCKATGKGTATPDPAGNVVIKASMSVLEKSTQP